MNNSSEKTAQTMELVAEAAGVLFAHWGYRPVVGRVWTALILSVDAIDSAGLRDTLAMSTGALSMALNELMDLGLIYRETKRNKRQFYYRAETDLLVIANHIFKKRERVKLVDILDKLKRAEAILDEESTRDDGGSYKLEQVRRLINLGEFVIDLLDAVMARTKVELKAAQKWLSVSGKLGGEPLSRIRRAINASRMRKTN